MVSVNVSDLFFLNQNTNSVIASKIKEVAFHINGLFMEKTKTDADIIQTIANLSPLIQP